MNILMLSCKKACELIDKRSVIKLSIKENMMLRLHTGLCDVCAAYQRQSIILDKVLHKHIHGADTARVPHFANNQLKEQIISKL